MMAEKNQGFLERTLQALDMKIKGTKFQILLDKKKEGRYDVTKGSNA